jgi:hypothetical protein
VGKYQHIRHMPQLKNSWGKVLRKIKII